jgi:hypothetical protein
MLKIGAAKMPTKKKKLEIRGQSLRFVLETRFILPVEKTEDIAALDNFANILKQMLRKKRFLSNKKPNAPIIAEKASFTIYFQKLTLDGSIYKVEGFLESDLKVAGTIPESVKKGDFRVQFSKRGKNGHKKEAFFKEFSSKSEVLDEVFRKSEIPILGKRLSETHEIIIVSSDEEKISKHEDKFPHNVKTNQTNE